MLIRKASGIRYSDITPSGLYLQPITTWQIDWPAAYGFYANVNPAVDHPRHSQSTERRLGEFRRRKTELFNGYGEHVAHLYTGMNLTRG